MTRKLTTIDAIPTPAGNSLADLRNSAEFREFLERKRTDIVRELDDLDRDIAHATRAHNERLAAQRHKHEDLSYVLAQCDAALAIEPLPPPAPTAAPVIVPHPAEDQ